MIFVRLRFCIFTFMYVFWFIEACMYVVCISVCACLRVNNLSRCGCSRSSGWRWHGTSPCLCSLLSRWAAILSKHSTVQAMLPHYGPAETHSPPFADQWLLLQTCRWEHNETRTWHILNRVREELLSSMEKRTSFYFKQKLSCSDKPVLCLPP